MQLLQQGNIPNTPYETYLCDSENEVSSIPNSAPTGSFALILTEDGLVVKIKDSTGTWKAV